MRRRIGWNAGVIVVLIVSAFAWMCSRELPTEPGMSAPRFLFKFADTAKVSRIERVILTVQPESGRTMTVPMRLEGNVVRGTVWVPEGWALFTIECKDRHGEVLYWGSTEAFLHAGHDIQVVVELQTTNRPPMANAGVDRTVQVGADVMLDGSGSSDPDGDVLTYRWTQISGPRVTLLGAMAVNPMFIPREAGVYVFALVVSDGQVESEADEVTVTVRQAGGTVTPGEMVLAPAGTFQMGDAFSEGDSNELPVHTVTVDAFYMDVVEVTNAMYAAFDPGHSSFNNTPDHPVEEVSWWDAIKYCNWRSRGEGLEEVYDESTGEADFSKKGYRLPTEAEWEYAARGGLEGKRYPWGDDISHEDANYSGTDGRDQWDGTSPVGSFSPNGYGLADMAGNVYEWVNDWYDGNYYSSSPSSNPTGPETGASRVSRGGSWYLYPSYLRCAYRVGYGPTDAGYLFGFRCVRSP